MQFIVEYVRLALDGLLLKAASYRDQREASDGLRRGFILVALIGLLVGLAALIGQLIEILATPASVDVLRTLSDGLISLPLYQDLADAQPGFQEMMQIQFAQITRVIQWWSSNKIIIGVIGIFLTPLVYLAGWLLSGTVAHTVARLLGGTATFSQTLSCTALAAGVGLLNLVWLVPFAQVSGVFLLGLIAQYLAIREAHRLPPGRAFWATVTGPLLLILVLVVAMVIGIMTFI